MKTHVCLALMVAALFTFTSCKKDYTCTCSYEKKSFYTGQYEEYRQTETFVETTKSDAKDRCNENKEALLNEENSGYENIECDID